MKLASPPLLSHEIIRARWPSPSLARIIGRISPCRIILPTSAAARRMGMHDILSLAALARSEGAAQAEIAWLHGKSSPPSHRELMKRLRLSIWHCCFSGWHTIAGPCLAGPATSTRPAQHVAIAGTAPPWPIDYQRRREKPNISVSSSLMKSSSPRPALADRNVGRAMALKRRGFTISRSSARTR